MPTKSVAKGITRFDLDNRRGYMVRIARSGNRVHQYFSDSKFGGKRKALAAAKTAYEELLEELGPAENSTRDKLTSRNTTGVVGVHVAYSQDNRYPGCEYYAYCASWVTEDGKREKASFAWNKYGQERALELAVLARHEQITDRDQVVAIYDRSAAGKRTKRAANASKKSSKPAKRSVKSSPAKPSAKRAAKKSVKKSALKSAKKSTKRAVKKSAKKSVKKQSTAKKSVKKPAKKSLRKSVKTPTAKKQAKKQVNKKVAKKKSAKRR